MKGVPVFQQRLKIFKIENENFFRKIRKNNRSKDFLLRKNMAPLDHEIEE